MLCYLHSREVIPRIQVEFLCSGFCPCPIVGHHWEEPGLVVLALSLQALIRKRLECPLGECCKILEIHNIKMPVCENLYCNSLLARDSDSSHHL